MYDEMKPNTKLVITADMASELGVTRKVTAKELTEAIAKNKAKASAKAKKITNMVKPKDH